MPIERFPVGVGSVSSPINFAGLRPIITHSFASENQMI